MQHCYNQTPLIQEIFVGKRYLFLVLSVFINNTYSYVSQDIAPSYQKALNVAKSYLQNQAIIIVNDDVQYAWKVSKQAPSLF